MSECCVRCGATKNITKHHLNGSGKGPFIYLCSDCHDEEHGIKRHEDINSLKRRLRRAERRIKRDRKIIEETKKQMASVESTKKEVKNNG